MLGLIWGALLLGGCPIEATSFTPLPPGVPRLLSPQNDVYWGSVHAGALRPTFTWAPSSSDTDDPSGYYELQYSSDASFPEGTPSARVEGTRYQPDAALPVSMTPPVGTRYYWRVRACIPRSCSDYSRARWINLGRSNKDYNGDGYADLAVGAPGDAEGRAYVYFGGPGATFTTSPSATLFQAVATSLGEAIASVGDVNGDGFSDLLVGASPSNAREGVAYLYLGGSGAFDTTTDGIFRGSGPGFTHGYAVSAAGDMNGDGLADFAIGAPLADFQGLFSGLVYIYFGSRSGVFSADRMIPSSFNDQIGKSLAPAGDVNGDGFADLAVGALGDLNFGSVYVFLGGENFDTTTDLKLPGNVSQDFEAAALASADFNGDSFSDLVVGVPAYSASANMGRLYLYSGGEVLKRSADLTLTGVDVTDKLGFSVSTGDINGDDQADLVVGSIMTSGISRAEVHLGRAGQLIDPADAGNLRGRVASDRYGAAVSSGGDFNGDGFDDIAVTAGGDGSGRVYVYFGSAKLPFSPTPAGILDGPANSRFGYALANP